jgi:PIN domain nuclease of toxin-antitoxin system
LKLLLDTHILLWVMQDADALSASARQRISAADEVYVSSIVLWELAIKVGLGKLKLDLAALDRRLEDSALLPLPVTWTHTAALRQLPGHHRDPFDRMLVAQAMSEPMHLLTHDAALAAYSPLVTVV